MASAHYHRFTTKNFIRRVDPHVWRGLLNRFSGELQAAGLAIPTEGLLFYAQLTGLLTNGIPDEMNRDLVAISELATRDGECRLRQALVAEGIDLSKYAEFTREELVMHTWTANSGLAARVYTEHHLNRLSAFRCFSLQSQFPSYITVQAITHDRLESLRKRLDAWFLKSGYGKDTTNITFIEVAKELWFGIDHGGNQIKTTEAVQQKRPPVIYREATDDAIVYSPQLQQLRINAEKSTATDMYRKEFGRLLFDSEECFCSTCYTLEPLRAAGKAALVCPSLENVDKVVLKEVRVRYPESGSQEDGSKDDDLFANGTPKILSSATRAEITMAVFEFQIRGERPRRVTLRPPNNLSLIGAFDPTTIQVWLKLQGFQVSQKVPNA